MNLRSFLYLSCASILLFFSGYAASDAAIGEIWEWRNPLPQGNSLYGVAHGNGRYVATGEAGAVLTSDDSQTWTVETSGTSEWLTGVAFGAGKFVVVGTNGTVLTSTNGSTWTAAVSGTTEWLWNVAYLDDNFWAVGSGGVVLSSPDGITWTIHPQDVTEFLRGIAFGNGTLLAVGDWGTILSSTDGENWVKEAEPQNPLSLHSVTFHNDRFVAVGANGLILFSLDGSTWTPSSPVPFHTFWSVTYAEGKFLTVGETGNLLTSPDGDTWTATSSGVSHTLRSIAPGSAGIVAVGSSGRIIHSVTGDSWTQVSAGIDTALYGVTQGSGQFVVSGASGRILTSDNTDAWTIRAAGTTQILLDVAHGNVADVNNPDIFVAVGVNGTIRRSVDAGETWQFSSPTNTGTISSVGFGNGTFVTVGRFGRIQSSPDGITWIRRLPDASAWLRSVRYGSDRFVAVGDNGTVVTSPDGAAWTLSNSGTNAHLHAVAYGDGKYIAVGANGVMRGSLDGETWTAIDSETTLSLQGIAFGNGIWVAVGDLGLILISDDGETWFEPDSATLQVLRAVTHTDGIFVIVGDAGTILVSTESTGGVDGLTFSQWVVQEGIPSGQRAINDTPAGDNVTNLVKFALGLDALSPGVQDLPELEIASFNGQPALALNMTQATDIFGAVLSLEVSTNLKDWQTTPHTLEVMETVSENLRRIRLIEDAAFTNDAKRFLRLRVTLDETPPDPEPATFSGWVAFHELSPEESGPLDDPAGDDVGNLIKFAMGIDPLVYTWSSNLTAQGEVMVDGEAHMTLTFVRSTTATAVEFVLQGSDNLSTWVDLPSVLTVIGPVDGDREEVFMTDTEPKTSSRHFIRLSVRQVP